MARDPLIGTLIGGFNIISLIGEGGMSSVYRAHQASMNRDVALKIIRLDRFDNPAHFEQRFTREAELIASLEHIHILPVFDYGVQDNIAYLVMRLLTGGTLTDVLNYGPMTLERTVEVTAQICRALEHAHQKGIIHRDLKPGNIMFDSSGSVLLTDFGLAKLIDEEDSEYGTNRIVGTPAYMSPEQLRGLPLDARSDQYALGLIVYEMLLGKRPFEVPSTELMAYIYHHLEVSPAPLVGQRPFVTPALESVVFKALGKRPEDRYDSVSDFLKAFRVAADIATGETRVITTEIPVTDRWLRRFSLMAMTLIILLLSVLTVSIFMENVMDEVPPRRQPTVLLGEIGSPADVVPTEGEITEARAQLGEEGFIALITCNRTSEYHAGAAREIVEFAGEYGLRVRIYDSDTDRSRQIPLIESARADGAVGLIICPLDVDLLDDELTTLDAQNIPLVLFTSRDDRFGYGGVIVDHDSCTLGRIAGDFAGEIIADELNGQADVVVLTLESLPNIVCRADNIIAGLLNKAPEANIVGRFRGATAEFGQQSIADLVLQGVDFDMIVSINDAGAFGAIQALEDADIPPEEVVIVGIDAEDLAVQYIDDGYFMRGSVIVDRTAASQAMVDSMVKLLAGSILPEDISVQSSEIYTGAEAPSS